jgi:hypothetical protein
MDLVDAPNALAVAALKANVAAVAEVAPTAAVAAVAAVAEVAPTAAVAAVAAVAEVAPAADLAPALEAIAALAETLDAIKGVGWTDETLKAIIEAVEGSAGPYSKVYTITVGGMPLAGVYCRLTTDVAGTLNKALGVSDSLGQVTFWHDLPVGTTVYVHAAPDGYDPLVDQEII